MDYRQLATEAVGAVNPLQAPGFMSAGRLSLILFLVVIVSSVWRKQLDIEYTRWRILHTVAATTAVLLLRGALLPGGCGACDFFSPCIRAFRHLEFSHHRTLPGAA